MAGISINNLPLGAESKYLSKVKIGNDIYFLKDAEVRAIIASLKEGAFVDVFDGDIKSQTEANKSQLVTAEQVKNAIASLEGAMHFAGVFDEGKKPANPVAGDIIIERNTSKEYVYDGTDWVELGEETAFVRKTTQIAGIDLQESIKADELAKALEDTLVADLKGTGTAQTISGLKATGNLSGTATIGTTTATVTSSGKYTPAGSITGSAISGGSISVTVKDADEATAATLTKGSYKPAGSVAIAKSDNGTAISGTVSAPNITVTPTNATVDYVTVTDAGTGYTLSNSGNATGTFASEGLKANVDETDTEMLVFTTAPTASVQYTAPVLSGSLPTFKTNNKLTYVSGIDSATATAPVFTGDKFGATFDGTEAKDILVTGVSYLKQEIATQTFTPVAATLGFEGTQGDLSVSGRYDKVNESAEVAVNNATLTVADINIAAQDVTISKKSA